MSHNASLFVALMILGTIGALAAAIAIVLLGVRFVESHHWWPFR